MKVEVFKVRSAFIDPSNPTNQEAFDVIEKQDYSPNVDYYLIDLVDVVRGETERDLSVDFDYNRDGELVSLSFNEDWTELKQVDRAFYRLIPVHLAD